MVGHNHREDRRMSKFLSWYTHCLPTWHCTPDLILLIAVSDYKLIIPKDAKDLSRLWDGPCDQNLRRKYLDEAQPIMEMAASCVIASPSNADRVVVSTTKERKYIHVRGYAVGQEGEHGHSVHFGGL